MSEIQKSQNANINDISKEIYINYFNSLEDKDKIFYISNQYNIKKDKLKIIEKKYYENEKYENEEKYKFKNYEDFEKYIKNDKDLINKIFQSAFQSDYNKFDLDIFEIKNKERIIRKEEDIENGCNFRKKCGEKCNIKTSKKCGGMCENHIDRLLRDTSGRGLYPLLDHNNHNGIPQTKHNQFNKFEKENNKKKMWQDLENKDYALPLDFLRFQTDNKLFNEKDFIENPLIYILEIKNYFEDINNKNQEERQKISKPLINIDKEELIKSYLPKIVNYIEKNQIENKQLFIEENEEIEEIEEEEIDKEKELKIKEYEELKNSKKKLSKKKEERLLILKQELKIE